MTDNNGDMSENAKLLEGIRVLDLTNVLSGPFCTYQLSLLGADVIKIENPTGGDLARQLGASASLNKKLMGASFLAQNAGKRSVTLNLKTPEGIRIFKSLCENADVVVENFRPGVMQRLGIGYDVLKEHNPGLIVCSISGFGQEGPMQKNPAYDQIVQGLSGVMSITGSDDEGTAPLRVGFPVCDTIGGLTASFAIVSALMHRERTKEGQLLDVSMLDSTIATLGWVVSNYLSAGVMPKAIGNENMTAAPSGAFQTGDGVLNIAANKQEQFEVLCKLIERDDLVTDPRFAGREDRKKNRNALNAELTRALLDNSAVHWEQLFNQAGVPAGRVLSVPEVLEHPQIVSRQLIQEFASDILDSGQLRVTRAGFTCSSGLPGVTTVPPTLGEHTAEVLQSIGISDKQLSDLAKARVI